MKTGYAFGEHIKTEKIRRRKFVEDGEPTLRARGFLLPVVLFVVTALIIFKLFSLQLIHGEEYSKLSDFNRTRTQIIHAPRGVIFDRNGTPLVFNTPGFLETICHPEPTKGSRLVSGSKKEEMSKIPERGLKQVQHDKNCKTSHLSREEALSAIAKGAKNIEVASLREYPYKDSLSHVLGYIGQISEEEIKSPEFAGYQGYDWIGKNGIEGEYEDLLKGIDGKQLVEVDALGKRVRSLGQTDPVAGQDITLTIDAKLQEATYKAAKDVHKGAIVVSTPDGQILAMVSKPSFDPNLFTLDTNYKAATDSAYPSLEGILLDNKNQPLLDRAISGTYPPGSTFKIVTAASGLETKTIDENYHIKDTGILKIGDFSFANWFYLEQGRTESKELDVTWALARSNDIFFYELAEKIGVDKLSQTAKAFGVGSRLGIDIGGEARGIVPNKQWKKEVLKEDWYLGDTYHYGIGQGYLLTTPLQVNAWTDVVANGGTLYQPRLFLNQESRIKNQELLSQKTTDLIREGMIESCTTGGVAWPLFDFKVKNPALTIDDKNFTKVATGSADLRHVSVACKTGTAQHGGEDTLPHAWITLFAPAYDPQIVVTVLVESSGQGSTVAAPIAKKILEAYFTAK